jgi:hypothetical protein
MRRRGTTAALAATALLTGAGTAYAAFATEPGSPYALGDTRPYNLNVGDFNGDGRPDVATINGDSGSVSVFLRQPGGGFAQEAGSPIRLGVGLSNAAVGDFNGDGLPDIAAAAFDFSGRVTVLLRQAGGGFAAEAQSVNVGTPLGAVAAGDFNGDGRLDLAVAGWDSNQVTILLRTTDNAGFTVGQTVATGANPRWIAVGDFDGNRLADLAVTNNGGAGSVTTLLGAGNGTFTSEGAVATGSAPSGVVAADFNGDGRSDMAVANSGSASVSVLVRNAANNGFADEAGSPITVSTTPIGLALADVDADGRLDLAVATYGNAVDILRRNAGGGFTRDPAIPVAGQQSGIGAGDFDGDGRADLAVSEITNSTFSALLNPAPAVATPTPTPTPTATPTPLPPPVAGKTVNAARKSGTVRFRRPGSKKFVTLTADAQIPVGSVIDTRKGRITITAAQGKGRTASADFFAGLFKLTQTKGKKPATTLRLTEKLSCPKRHHRASAAAKKPKKKPKSRHLWGSGHGRFTTRGSYSAATVRGTRWLVRDSCRTTTTRVTAGVVSVRDFVKRKTVLLRKGKRYVARRR